MTGNGKLPPHDEQAERAVLGAILLGGDAALDRVLPFLRPEHFYATAHQKIYEACVRVHKDEEGRVDHVLIRSDLERAGDLEKIGGEAYLAQLAAQVPSSAGAEDYARIVREKHVSRSLIHVCTSIQSAAYEGGTDADELRARAADQLAALSDAGADEGSLVAPLVADLIAAPAPPREWLIENWLRPKTTLVLYGSSYVGKTLLGYQMALATSRGEGKFLGHEVKGGARETLVLIGENDPLDLRDAFLAMIAGGGAPPTLRYWDVFGERRRRPLATEAGMAWLRSVVAANRSEVVVLDNAMSLVGGNLRDPDVATFVMEGLKRISKEMGTSFGFLMHTRKEGSQGDEASRADKLYGCHEWLSYSDAAVYVGFENGDERDNGRRVVYQEKCRGLVGQHDRILIELDEPTLTAHPIGQLGREKNDSKTTPLDALLAIRDLGGLVAIPDALGARLKVSRRTVYRLVGSDEFKGWIADGTIVVEARGPKGGPAVLRFVGPVPGGRA